MIERDEEQKRRRIEEVEARLEAAHRRMEEQRQRSHERVEAAHRRAEDSLRRAHERVEATLERARRRMDEVEERHRGMKDGAGRSGRFRWWKRRGSPDAGDPAPVGPAPKPTPSSGTAEAPRD